MFCLKIYAFEFLKKGTLSTTRLKQAFNEILSDVLLHNAKSYMRCVDWHKSKDLCQSSFKPVLRRVAKDKRQTVIGVIKYSETETCSWVPIVFQLSKFVLMNMY